VNPMAPAPTPGGPRRAPAPRLLRQVTRGLHAFPTPWPAALPGRGPRRVQAFTPCAACGTGTWVAYGPLALCLRCALQRQASPNAYVRLGPTRNTEGNSEDEGGSVRALVPQDRLGENNVRTTPGQRGHTTGTRAGP
jgi:hypothetical protein